MPKATVSTTGIIHGRGRDRFKWVSGLTKEERLIVRKRGIVLIPDDNPHHNTAPYKRVIFYNGTNGGRYFHQNATSYEMSLIDERFEDEISKKNTSV